MLATSPAVTTIGEPYCVGPILFNADEFVANWVHQRIPHNPPFGPCRALGVVQREQFVGGVVYHGYRGFDVFMSCAFEHGNWVMPGTVRALFAYPFLDLKCVRVTAYVGRKNKRSRKLCERLGFTFVGVFKRGLDGFEDVFLFEMLQDDCRWIKDKGNELRPAVAASGP